MTYLIYCYTSPSQKRYIGQTCESLFKRAGKDGVRYKTSSAFWKAIQKYGWEYFQNHCEILATAKTQEEANRLESYFINLYHTTDKKYGYNILSGGYDGFGHLNDFPVIGINLINKDICYFISYSDASRKIGVQESVISEIIRGTGRYNTTHGWTFILAKDYFQMTDSSKKQIYSIIPNEKPALRKKVRCINTGEIFDSVTNASKSKQCSRTHLSQVCKGTRNTCGKDENGIPLRWEYVDTEDLDVI